MYDSPKDFRWLKKFRYERIDRIIYSLLLPEHKNKTNRYLGYSFYTSNSKENDKKSIFDLITGYYMIVDLYYMYTSYYILCWIDDDMYKILEFNSTRCPSGGCDGSSIHYLVGISVEDVMNLLDFQLLKVDREKIKSAFNNLPNKKRIIERTKKVKEEMMATFWHPDRYEKWILLEGDDDD